MIKVDFFDPDFLPDSKLIYSVIAARYNDKWVFVRHHKRSSFEIPGGHIEENETPYEAAKRELMEETGALKFSLACVSTYSVTIDGVTQYGRLFYAEVFEIGHIPDVSEIIEVAFLDTLPVPVTHPEIQPHLFKKVLEYLKSAF
jgi:8-oxo-dGTP diphosphatase